MEGIEHTAGQSNAIVKTADNDRLIREFESYTSDRKQTLVHLCMRPANGAALVVPSTQPASFDYEAYIATELVPNVKSHLDSVLFPTWKTKYEKEIVVSYRETVEVGFLERVASRQRGFWKRPESIASIEFRIWDSISHYGNTPGPSMSDAEFESLIADM